MGLEICYHSIQHSFSEIPRLPEVYIVSTQEGSLQYIEKQATPETLQSANINYKNTPHQQVLTICSDLKISELEKRFQPKNSRKKQSLAQLLKDPRIKKVLQNFIIRKLATFYDLIIQNNYFFSLEAERNVALATSEIKISTNSLHPILQFTKTENGITYAFTLQENDVMYTPKDHQIHILLNDPGYIILDQRLYKVESLNANKLKPFLDKETIQVPTKLVKTYLEKIIIPIIKNIEVQTQGFEINIDKNIHTCTLEIVKDFIRNKFIAKVIFEYQYGTFEYQTKKRTLSQIDMQHDEHIRILQTQRNDQAEKAMIDLLLKKGLHLTTAHFLEVPAADDSFEIFTWIKNNQQHLENDGFKIVLPIIKNKNITLDPYQISLTSNSYQDWFDVRGTIIIGNKHIPFTKFIPYIRDHNRHFSVDSDTLFIIPLSWMHRYHQLTTFGKQKGERFLVNKSNYPVLQKIVPPDDIAIQLDPQIAYQPSTLLKATLRSYQLAGVQWLVQHYQNNLGACLADDMGLGKTLQTIAMLVYAKEHTDSRPKQQNQIQFDLFSDPLEIKSYLNALIVLPSSLVFNWAQELKKFAPHLSIVLYTGSDRIKLSPYLDSYDVILTSYSILTRDITTINKFQYSYLVIDESQQIKNKESKVFQAINQISTLHKISLSGTPIENSLSDLWSLMQFINPGILGSFSFFNDYFKIPIEKHQDMDRIDELKSIIDPFILRRIKEKVAKDLPELSEQIQYTQMLPKQEKRYESEKSAARNLLLSIDQSPKNKIKILNTLLKLRQLANHPLLVAPESEEPSGKFRDVTHFIDTLLKSDKKILVFSSFVAHLSIYENWCLKNNISFVSLTGKTPVKEREQVIRRFQEQKSIQIFFISLKAGGVGLNLTEASYVILLDPWWNPFAEKQAIARAHRIGQEKNVLVTRFITKDTIEEKIIKLQEKKKQLSDDIIETGGIPQFAKNDLDDLLR